MVDSVRLSPDEAKRTFQRVVVLAGKEEPFDDRGPQTMEAIIEEQVENVPWTMRYTRDICKTPVGELYVLSEGAGETFGVRRLT